MITFLVTLLLLSVLVFVVWASRQAEKAGRTSVTADEQAELLARAEQAEEAEREIEDIQRRDPGGAVERLRRSAAYRGE